MWLPKWSAPKDGNYFLAIETNSKSKHAPFEFVSWNGERFCAGETSEEVDFKYWMPLPEAPINE